MEKEFIAYEYKEKTINKQYSDLYLDCIINLGYEVTDKNVNLGKVNLHLKRNFKIQNRNEVITLEKQFEEKFKELEKINNEKKDLAIITSLSIGLIGTALLAGATFSFLANNILLMILLAIPGFIGWFFPYFIYKKIGNKSQIKVNNRTEELRFEIYQIIEKAFNLLNK